MDFYLILKFLHVASTVVWIGAGVGLVILGIAANSRKDNAGFVRIMQDVVFLAPRVFVPASLATLVFGVAAAWTSFGFEMLWIDLGIIGYAATFVTGNYFLRPRADRITKLVAEGGASDHAVAAGRELLGLAKFDYALLFIVVADMVFKPTLDQWGVLVVLAIVLAGAAVLFLVPVIRGHHLVGVASA
ncbi:MAG TPA: DUF2269 family protein [Bauldia sp.]